jgi:hypothetical protein
MYEASQHEVHPMLAIHHVDAGFTESQFIDDTFTRIASKDTV